LHKIEYEENGKVLGEKDIRSISIKVDK